MENLPPQAPDWPPESPGARHEDERRSGLEQCVEALLAIARRPSRSAFATWTRVVEPAWIPRLFLALVAFDMLSGLAGLAISQFIAPPDPSPPLYRFGVPSLADRLIYALIVFPLFDLLVLALVVFGSAVLKPAEQEQVSVRERARRILRPYLLGAIIAALVSLLIGDPLLALQYSPLGQGLLAPILVLIAPGAILIYSVVVLLNALAAGSGVSRWLLIVVMILGGIIGGVIGLFGLGALLALVGIHLPLGL